MSQVTVWIDVDSKMAPILKIDAQLLLKLCRFPAKWARFVGEKAHGTRWGGRLCAAKPSDSSNPTNTLCLTPLPESSLSDVEPLPDYYFVPNKRADRSSKIHVDPQGMVDRVSNKSNDPASKRSKNQRGLALLRDHVCVVCGREDFTYVQAAHLIPHSKTPDYLQHLNDAQYQDLALSGPRLESLGALQNTVLVGTNVHTEFQKQKMAFLVVSKRSFLQESDIPTADGNFVPNRPPLTGETKKEALKQLTGTKVEPLRLWEKAEIAEEYETAWSAAPDPEEQPYAMIYQKFEPERESLHFHNTRCNVPSFPAHRIPQYVADFHYVSSVLSFFGSNAKLGHTNALLEEAYYHAYYPGKEPPKMHDGPRLAYMVQLPDGSLEDPTTFPLVSVAADSCPIVETDWGSEVGQVEEEEDEEDEDIDEDDDDDTIIDHRPRSSSNLGHRGSRSGASASGRSNASWSSNTGTGGSSYTGSTRTFNTVPDFMDALLFWQSPPMPAEDEPTFDSSACMGWLASITEAQGPEAIY